ncbi:probable serine/threonine-protein kinase clkA isoform X2 [Phymastichus coffea]|uniref:probable serine/threonine-protein kinase clkA isoform X2 n=1 Tax=Phymastichus coffea TaxID=108790 RepID=UPI00273BF185|nr:probable serine/threonine-protein kinase clkA isoform X2 [Phymastichus coffea]
MAESNIEKKEDSLEESLYSEEWTIIDQKESKIDIAIEEDNGNQTSDLIKETLVTENTEESKPEVEQIEEGEEAGENDIESDDVSILSDESESEQLIIEEGRIQKIEWRVESQSNQSKALIPNISLGESSSPHMLISSTCLICSLIVVTFAIVIAGRVANLKGDITNYGANVNIAEKLKELEAIEDKLKELSDVKQALDQILTSMPEMKKLKDQLAYQKSENNKFKYSLEDYKNFINLNNQNNFNSNIKNDRLEMLVDTYTNLCLIMNKVNSSNADMENDLCRTPTILSDMINLKKNLKLAFENSQETAMPEKRMFTDAGRKLDVISDSLLSDFSTMFVRFSFKMHRRLNKFGFELYSRLCLLNDFEKSDDKFLNILLDDDFFVNHCNVTADPVTADYRSNTSYSKKLNYRETKKNITDESKKNEKNDYKSNKGYEKYKDTKEEYTNASEGEPFNNIANTKSKGEAKHDNWKTNNEKYYHVENKFNKNEKFRENNKNGYRHKRESKSDFNKSFEKIETNYEYNNKNNKKDTKFDRKQDYKKDSGYDYREFEYKKDHNTDFKVYYDREYYSSEQNFEDKRDHDYAYGYESKRNDEFERKLEKKKVGKYDKDVNDDSKFIIKMDNIAEDIIKNNNHEQQKYKNKEYVLKPENFKESKYAKYDNHERRDRKDKYPTGEWQMQRGKAREKQRNSDWYFVRADSRQQARSNDGGKTEEKKTIRRASTRPNNKKRADTYRDKPNNFRGRIMKKVAHTWDFLNKKIRNYF